VFEPCLHWEDVPLRSAVQSSGSGSVTTRPLPNASEVAVARRRYARAHAKRSLTGWHGECDLTLTQFVAPGQVGL